MEEVIYVIIAVVWFCAPAKAQSVLFEFDSAPLHTSLPISLTAGGITAHFSAPGQGFPVQQATVPGFAPADFSGHCLNPNGVLNVTPMPEPTNLASLTLTLGGPILIRRGAVKRKAYCAMRNA